MRRLRKNRIANTEGIQGRIKDDRNAKFYVRVQGMETHDCKGAQYCDTTAEIHGSTITYAARNGTPRHCFMDTKP